MSVLHTAVRCFAGVPALHINGRPETGLMHWNRNMTAGDVRAFRQSGIRLFSFIGNIDLQDGAPVHDAPGAVFRTMSPEYIDSMMRQILNGAQDALVIPRFRLQASEEWKKRHPGSLMRTYDLEKRCFEDEYMVSLASEEWIREALAALKQSLEYCEKRWGEHIAGYHSGFGHCAEHVWHWGPKVADYNPAMIRIFRDFLHRKYTDADILRRAWNAPEASFETAELPAPEKFSAFQPSVSALWNPECDQQQTDFLRCQSEYMAGLVVRQAEAVKEKLTELGSEKIFGAFYGYVNLPANLVSHYANGHDAHEIVLNCKSLDFLSAPVGYSARQPGGVSTAQLLPSSVLLAGKLYFAEDDTETHLSNTAHNIMPATTDQSLSMIERGFLDVWRSGGTQWFMDLFGEGSYHDSRIMQSISRLTAFAERHLADKTSTAEIAVFISTDSLAASKSFHFLSGGLIEQQLNEIAAIGASFDTFRLEDLTIMTDKFLEHYKFVLILNAHIVDDVLREELKSKLKRNGRTVLWFHAPGIVRNGKYDPDSCCELTGMHLVRRDNRNSRISEAILDGKRISFGTARSINPNLYGADPDAESLAYAVEGTFVPFRAGSDGATLMRRRFPEWTSIWSATPNLPSAFLTQFAQEAGVHIWSPRGDQIMQTKNWVAVHCKWNGTLELRFPLPGTWADAFSGETMVENGTVLRRKTLRGENIVLELRG